MDNTVSFMSANYVAREVGYNMTGGWGQGDRATSESFRPIETFGVRFGEILGNVRTLGFAALDLWTAHLNPLWVTEAHITTVREELDQYDLTVPSLGGWFGSNHEEFEASCKLAAALGVPLLGGSTSVLEKDRAFVIGRLRHYGLRLGLENHPEKTPQELRDKIEAGEGVIGATVDTGWFSTQGYDAAHALEELADVLFYVHLKDVRAAGDHDTCRYGEGIVPVRECVAALHRIGYTGAISVEHEPELFDPTDDVRASRELLQGWMAEHGA